jgi:outer membrane lipoprotein SlyB
MKHVLYALFPSRDDASAAIRELSSEGVSRDRCRIVVAERAPRPSELDLAFTGARKAVAFGVVVGALVGGLFGAALAGPLHVTEMGVLSTAIFTAVAGGGIGALGGVLSGSMNPDATLEQLRARMEPGAVMASVEVEALTVEEVVERVFLAHGAMQLRRSLV